MVGKPELRTPALEPQDRGRATILSVFMHGGAAHEVWYQNLPIPPNIAHDERGARVSSIFDISSRSNRAFAATKTTRRDVAMPRLLPTKPPVAGGMRTHGQSSPSLVLRGNLVTLPHPLQLRVPGVGTSENKILVLRGYLVTPTPPAGEVRSDRFLGVEKLATGNWRLATALKTLVLRGNLVTPHPPGWLISVHLR